MLRPYLDGTRVRIQTDQDSLECVLNHADATRHLAHWRLHLFEFQFDVDYPAEIKHQATDALSRPLTTGADSEPRKGVLPVVVIDTNTPDSTKVRLENLQEAISQVFEYYESLKGGPHLTLQTSASINQLTPNVNVPQKV